MIATLVFPKHDNIVYLALKKRNFGAGYLNGWGGKAEDVDGNVVKVTACREFVQEGNVTITPDDIELVAVIYFYEKENLVFECHVYFLNKWEGEIQETEEMGPPQPFYIENLPYDQMWKADRIWLPLILKEGKKIRAKAVYEKGMQEVESFEYEAL